MFTTRLRDWLPEPARTLPIEKVVLVKSALARSYTPPVTTTSRPVRGLSSRPAAAAWEVSATESVSASEPAVVVEAAITKSPEFPAATVAPVAVNLPLVAVVATSSASW